MSKFNEEEKEENTVTKSEDLLKFKKRKSRQQIKKEMEEELEEYLNEGGNLVLP